MGKYPFCFQQNGFTAGKLFHKSDHDRILLLEYHELRIHSFSRMDVSTKRFCVSFRS
jgi:hypothetical protein